MSVLISQLILRDQSKANIATLHVFLLGCFNLCLLFMCGLWCLFVLLFV